MGHTGPDKVGAWRCEASPLRGLIPHSRGHLLLSRHCTSQFPDLHEVGASSQLTACSKVPVFTHSRRDPEPWGTIFTTCLSQPARMPYSHTRLPPRKHRAYPRGCTAMRAQAPSQGQREAPPLPSPRSRASHFGLLEQWLRVLQQLHYKSATELTCMQGLQSRCPTPSSGTEGVGGSAEPILEESVLHTARPS